MPKGYSDDLRARVINAVESGASRREAAESFNLSASSAVRWLQRWKESRVAAAMRCGGSRSRLDDHADWLLNLVAERPDLTLKEIVAAMRKRRIRGSRTAVWRFFKRHNITVKKNSVRGRTESTGCGTATPTLDARARHV
jgi:transposase